MDKKYIELIDQVKISGNKISEVYKSIILGGKLNFELKDDVDFVTELDIEIENDIRKKIIELFPEHTIIGEELGTVKGNEFQWYIDPIDGTKYFGSGMPIFNISVGLRFNGKNIFGIVYNPIGRDLIYGGEGIGAFRNGVLLDEVQAKPLCKSSFYIDTVGVNKLSEDESKYGLNFLESLIKNVYRTRMFGASVFASYGCATGLFSGTIDLFGKQKDVDMCAYSAILQQIGYVEKKVKIGNKENIWIVLPENYDELIKLIKNDL